MIKDIISANVSLYKLFTCIQSKLSQTWLVGPIQNTSSTKNHVLCLQIPLCCSYAESVYI